MDSNIIPSIMAFNISLIMAIIFLFVYLADRSSKEIKYLGWLCFSAVIYVTGQIMLNGNTDSRAGIFWHKFQHIGIAVIISAWINYVFSYSGKERNLFITVANWAAIALSALLVMTNLVITSVPYNYAGSYLQGKEGPLYYYALMPMLVASLFYGYWILILKFKNNEGVRTYDAVMLLGTGVAILAGVHDIYSVIDGRQGITLFEYGLTVMCATLVYAWIIGKGFHEKNAIKNIFNTYIAYPIIGKDGAIIGDDSSEPEITVLFADICGYTSLSEQLTRTEIVEVLNKFMASIFDIVEKYGGTFDKFIGDGVMVIFDKEGMDHSEAAVRAAVEIRDKMNEVWTRATLKKHRTLGVGIGINRGKVIKGNIGVSQRKIYTVIGDAVNTAFRLEDLAKEGMIMISKSVYDRVNGKVIAESIGEISLKGKKDPITVFNVLGMQEEYLDALLGELDNAVN